LLSSITLFIRTSELTLLVLDFENREILDSDRSWPLFWNYLLSKTFLKLTYLFSFFKSFYSDFILLIFESEIITYDDRIELFDYIDFPLIFWYYPSIPCNSFSMPNASMPFDNMELILAYSSSIWWELTVKGLLFICCLIFVKVTRISSIWSINK